MLCVKIVCNVGHSVIWRSQSLVRGIAEGNLRLAAAVLFSGNTFSRMSSICSFAGIRFIAEKTYFRYQKDYLFGVVNEAWLTWRGKQISHLQGKECCLVGNGRCDSPGHSAKYCTYTFQDQDTCEFIDFNVMQVTEVGSSNRMEKRCFVNLLDKIEKLGVKVKQITTDRHLQIRKYIREKRKDIIYQFDVWHVAKSIFKKLLKIAKKTGTKFHKCEHDEIDEKAWLKEGSPAYAGLQKVIFERKLLTDINHLDRFSHSGNLELYHAVSE